MTDRINALTVVLESGIREDDCEVIIQAIKMIRGVVAVDKHIDGSDNYIAKAQLKSELSGAMMEFFKNLR